MPADHEITLETSRGFDGKLVHVRVDRVRMPSGRESVREVIEHPGAVAVVAITTEDEIVLVRQWRHAVGQELTEIPAGTQEPGESTIDTARRELLEETGYRAGSLREIATYFSSAGFLDEQMTLFLATECQLNTKVLDEDEHTTVQLVPRSGLRDWLESPDTSPKDAKTLVGLLCLLANLE